MNAAPLERPSPAAAAAPVAALPGKYFTFSLGGEAYAVPVLKVREITRMPAVTPVPQTPAYVRGVTNLRGRVVPVIDLRLKFGLPEAALTEHTCLLVVQAELPPGGARRPLGLVVDAVEEVVSLAAADIEAAPHFGPRLDTAYLLGMAKVKGRVNTLLNIDRVIAADSIEPLDNHHHNVPAA